MKKEEHKVMIMYGLPGSGKTWWCSKNVRSYDKYIDLDYYAKTHEKTVERKSFEEWVEDYLIERISHVDTNIYIDGLITTLEALGSVIRAVITATDNQTNLIIEINIWNEDRETCLYNDFNRRDISSEISIKNLPYDKINSIEQIWKCVGNDYVGAAQFLINRHYVVRKPTYKKWFEEKNTSVPMSEIFVGSIFNNNFTQTQYLYSEEWSLGGTVCGYSGFTDTVSGEAPREFDELYNLLEEIDPNMSFLLVRKLFKECVEIEEDGTSDYYGGHIKTARYKADLEKIYLFIQEWYSEE